MKAELVIAGTLIAILGSAALAMASEIQREPLDRLWEEHMLAGTSANYRNGRAQEGRVQYIPRLEQAKGSWVVATQKPQAVRVSDSRGTGLFGLLRGGGWALDGGLLDQTEEHGGAVELYIKKVAPVYPGLLDHSAPRKEQSYEFFLLYRPNDAPQARILNKWVINPEQVHWYVRDYLLQGPLRVDDKAILRANETSDVRGFLAYDPTTKIATITITGLKQPFEDRVDLSAALAN